MKKIFSIFVLVLVSIIFSGCQTDVQEYEIAMVTDKGTIDDESFNQGTWEGIKEYAKENDISHKYYKPEGVSTTEYVDAIDLAIQNGAQIVVTPGYLFEEAIYEAQTTYPDVTFILIDGVPHAGDYVPDIKDNVYSIKFAEHESGFLAGYAAVKEGFTKLGFMGGLAVPAVVKFGYGYLQGAEYAAEEMGLADGSITVKYTYLNDFEAKPEFQTQATSWYNGGTEVIFTAAGGAGTSAMNAADALDDKYVIGVDVDQSGKSESVITSAKKELSNAVYQCLKAIYNEDEDSVYVPGETTILDATNDGIGLPDDFSRFDNFTKEDYNDIFTRLKNNTDNIRTNINDTIEADITVALAELNLVKVNVDVVG